MAHRRYIGVIIVVLVVCAGVAVRLARARDRHWPASVVASAAAPRTNLRLTDVTAAMGIRFVYRDPIMHPLFEGRERLVFWGSGAAIFDANGDGWMDVFLVTGRQGDKNHLYLNDGGTGFTEQGAAWGVADTSPKSYATAPVVFDYDNDGRPDLYLAGLGCGRLLHNTGTRFEDVSSVSGLGDCNNGMAAVPLDVDQDGNLDLYVLRYWSAVDMMSPPTSELWPENYVNALNGGVNTLYRNTGHGRFEDVTGSVGGGDTHWSLDGAWGDLTGSGQMRLYVANDFGADVVYARRGSSLVDESARSFTTPDRRFGMGTSLGDLGADGVPHVFVTNEYVDGYNQTGNFLWRFGEDGRAHDDAPARGIDDCGWAWGSVFADFDVDGRQDLYVANGFITAADRGTKDMISVYYDNLRNDYAFKAGTMMSTPGVVASDVRRWPPLGALNYAGHQTDCLFLNTGDRFVDVARDAGVDDDDDGRAAATIDFDNDGSVDLLVTTQNGPPHLYRNEVHAGRHWLGLRLEGTRSSRDAVGARVEVRQGGRAFFRWATGGKTGFLASSDPRLHVGLPEEVPADVLVRWPGGAVQSFLALAPGRYHTLREGP